MGSRRYIFVLRHASSASRGQIVHCSTVAYVRIDAHDIPFISIVIVLIIKINILLSNKYIYIYIYLYYHYYCLGVDFT